MSSNRRQSQPEAQNLLRSRIEMTGILRHPLNQATQSSQEGLIEFDPYQEYPLDDRRPLPRKQSTSTAGTTDVDSEKNPDAVNKERASSAHAHASSRRFNLCVLVPALVTAVLCAGTASALIGWLVSRRVVAADNSAFGGAIVAFEGLQNNVSREGLLAHLFDTVRSNTSSSPDTSSETTLFGLAISSVATHLVSFTLPFILSTFAYILASMWVQAQMRGRVDSLPTPTQYGHLIGLCGSFGLASVYDAGKYLSRGRKARPPASTALIAAFLAALVALILNYLLSLADLWLHTTAKTFSYEFAAPIVGSLLPIAGSVINITLCPGPALFLQGEDTYSNCQHSGPNEFEPDLFWGNADLVNDGLAVLGNTSVSSQVQMINDLAMLLPKNLPGGVKNLVFSTFAMNATCAPIADCQYNIVLDNQTSVLGCSEFIPPFTIQNEQPPLAMSMLNQFDVGTNTMVFKSGTAEQPAINAGPNGTSGYALNSTINPVGVLVDLYYDDGNQPVDAPVNQPGWYGVGSAPIFYLFYISRCVLDVWDVSISYTATADASTAPSFTIASDYPMARTDFNTTSALLGALDAAYSAELASRLSASLQGSVNISSDDFSRILAGNLSQGILALAAPLTERTTSVQGEAVSSATVSRYPLVPLCVLLALVYGYSALALGVGIAACLLPSRVITDREMAGSGEGKSTRELDLVHSRLTKPRMCIADRFDDESAVEEIQRLGVGFTNSGRAGGSDEEIFKRNLRRFKVDMVDNLEDI
ncbi:hypothetical protein FB45DRAFT_997966 [Roridomyces roridus]|uniref:Uncharacterized protein n=1 Tax=Roridomyces roridus TaxID=1738132 RepID=A0AAD7FZJ2_9AGAR|nr:hypothetical protein FB45DRAFT_997966 [Roridomyces roridus]